MKTAFTRTVRDDYEVLLMMQAILDVGGTVVSVCVSDRERSYSSRGDYGTPSTLGYRQREVYAVLESADDCDRVDDRFDKRRDGR